MKPTQRILLIVDCIVNLLFGVLLLFYPAGIITVLGLPPSNTSFYPSILGAVLTGIGFALFLELIGFEKQVRGLGLGGAVVINFMGATVLIGWLLFGALVMPLRGQILLWIVGLVVLGIGIAEVITKSWQYTN